MPSLGDRQVTTLEHLIRDPAPLPRGLRRSFEIDAACRDGDECVAVLRKAGAWPARRSSAPTAAELNAKAAALRNRVARLVGAARELERVKRSSRRRVTEPLRAAKARLGPVGELAAVHIGKVGQRLGRPVR